MNVDAPIAAAFLLYLADTYRADFGGGLQVSAAARLQVHTLYFEQPYLAFAAGRLY